MSRRWVQILLIIFLTGAFYAPSLRNGFIWDDDEYVFNNPSVQSQAGLSEIWFTYEMPQYYPVVFSSFWLEHKLWGVNPVGYHIVNLAIHILNALLIYLILLRLSPRLAFASGLLFALHPVQVETVAWVSERKNLLGCFFYLLAFLAYLNYFATARFRHYLSSLGAFVLALLSKSITVCFVVAPLFVRWWRNEKISRKDLFSLLPFGLVGLACAINTVYLEVHKVGAKGEDWVLSVSEHLVLAGQIVLFYIYKILFPFELVFFYPKWQLDAGQPMQWFPLLGVLLLAGILYRFRGRIGRGAFANYLFFLCAIFPALGFFNVYPMLFSYVADHFQYIASINLILLLAGAGRFLADRWLSPAGVAVAAPWRKYLPPLVLATVVLFYGAKIVDHSRSFHSLEILWTDVLARNERSWIAHNNLGLVYQQQGKVDAAVASFRRAAELDPRNAQAFNNLGILYYAQGRVEEARSAFLNALAANDTYANTYVNLGLISLNSGEEEQARAYLFRALELNPRLVEAHFNLAEYYLSQRQTEPAIAALQRTLELRPDYVQAQVLLGDIHAQTGRPQLALDWYRRALRVQPELAVAHAGIGLVMLDIGDPQGAIAAFESALRYNPDLVEGLMGMGFASLQLNHPRQAAPYFRAAESLGVSLPPEVVEQLRSVAQPRAFPSAGSRK